MNVMVGMASIPARARSLKRAVERLAPQVDRLAVSLNGYAEVPAFLAEHANVEATLRADAGGDAEKFASVDDWDGYVLTCDDDILYPSDYVQTLVAGLDRHGRDKLVSFHGGTTEGWNGAHSAASVKRIRCLGGLREDDAAVNVVGTGVVGWHSDQVPIWRDVFRTPNMADVYLAGHARTFGIPMVALAHRPGWLQDICPTDSEQIYESNRNGDGSIRDTRAARKAELDRFDWTSEPPGRPRVRVSVATCQRPHLLADLLADLDRESRWVDLEVSVYEDPTAASYAKEQAMVKLHRWQWHRFDRHLGRRDHYQLVSRELADCRGSAADWFVFLPDDIRLVRHAIPRAIETWSRLEDPATLTLWRLKDHEGQTNWTGRLPEEREHAWEVFHVDGIYLCRRETLAFLEYGCPPPARRRATSSGVGRTMSLRLHRAHRRMYRVERSLAVPVPDVPSVMNPDAGDRVYPGVAL